MRKSQVETTDSFSTAGVAMSALLVVVPVAYTYLDGFGARVRRLVGRAERGRVEHERESLPPVPRVGPRFAARRHLRLAVLLEEIANHAVARVPGHECGNESLRRFRRMRRPPCIWGWRFPRIRSSPS